MLKRKMPNNRRGSVSDRDIEDLLESAEDEDLDQDFVEVGTDSDMETSSPTPGHSKAPASKRKKK